MTRKTMSRLVHMGPVLAVLASAGWAAAPETVEPPPNAAATVEWNAGQGRLSLRYHDGVILEATVGAEDSSGRAVAGAGIKLEPAESRDSKEKVEQRLKFTVAKPQEGVKLVLRGTVTGSEEAVSRRNLVRSAEALPTGAHQRGPEPQPAQQRGV